jgi:hypothetical protein
VSPKQLRDRFLEKIQRLYQRYEQLNDWTNQQIIRCAILYLQITHLSLLL